ncbi:hypothetical protein [Caproicibacterium sp. XB2]|uniref:hypothetical protein n=1 Tax=Caproicibacterium sp. XB2 TaxID=3388458 RepID=UPI003851338C
MFVMYVAPYTGAWIEIAAPSSMCCDVPPSLPTRERGLKSSRYRTARSTEHVAPYTGAWIEILVTKDEVNVGKRRSLHGSVD